MGPMEWNPRMTGCIPPDDWATIVRHVPIASVDLIVVTDGGLVLTKRANQPAKGEWFIPGGRIRKNEPLDAVVHWVANEELGVAVEIRERLGAFDHFYETSDVPGTSKHYVAHGFVVEPETDAFETDDQHEAVHVFNRPPADIHQHILDYLVAAESVNFEL